MYTKVKFWSMSLADVQFPPEKAGLPSQNPNSVMVDVPPGASYWIGGGYLPVVPSLLNVTVI
jgi:hypothetical protein